MSMNTAVVLDKDSGPRDELRNRLARCGVVPICFNDEWVCLENIHHIRPGFALVRTDSTERVFRFVNVARAIVRSFPIVVLSKKNGVADLVHDSWMSNLYFLRYPLQPGVLRRSIQLLANGRLVSHASALVAASPGRTKLMRLLPRLGACREPILIQGQAGVGKKKIARAIIGFSPFVSVVPDFVDARRLTGRWIRKKARTLEQRGGIATPERVDIIANIEALPVGLQSRLLLWMDGVNGYGNDHPGPSVALPLITLSDQNLFSMVNRGAFRKDLFHRLSVITVTVPQLRGQVADIQALAEHYAVRYGIRYNGSLYRLSAAVLKTLGAYSWPGNVAELKRVIRQLVLSHRGRREEDQALLPGSRESKAKREGALGGIDADDVRNYLKQGGDLSLKQARSRYTKRVEKTIIAAALNLTQGNCKRAAGLLDISYKTMLTKAKMYRLIG